MKVRKAFILFVEALSIFSDFVSFNSFPGLNAIETRTTIVVSNGRYTFYQIPFIKYCLSNAICSQKIFLMNE